MSAPATARCRRLAGGSSRPDTWNVTQPLTWRYVNRHTLSGDFMAANWLRLDSTLAINMDHVTSIERNDETVVFSFTDGKRRDVKLSVLP
jgi:hypothetical protein